MQSAKLSRTNTWFGVGLVATAHLANDTVTSMLPALLPALAARFSLEAADLALLVGVFAISTSMPQPFFGLLADRLGRRWLAAMGLGVSASLIAGLSTASSVTGLWLALLIGGLGSAAVHPAGLGLTRSAVTGNPGLAVAVFSSAGMVGGAAGPVLAIGIASAWGLEQLAWTAVPVALVALIVGCVGRDGPAAVQPAPVSLGRRLLQGPVAWLTVVALFANLVMLTFTSSVPIWLVTERGLPDTSPVIGFTLATFAFAAAVGGIFGGVLARRWQPDKLIVGSLAASVIALQGILLAVPGSAPYVVAVAGAGALLGLHGPLLIAKAQELTPGAESAVAGVLLGATSGAAGLIYVGLGVVQSALGVGTTLAAVSLLVLPAAHLAAVTLRPRHPRPTPACTAACVHQHGHCSARTSAAWS